jgi:hypothetical protein
MKTPGITHHFISSKSKIPTVASEGVWYLFKIQVEKELWTAEQSLVNF